MEKLVKVRVALRSKGQSLVGFGKTASSHHCLVPRTECPESTESAFMALKVDLHGWRIPPISLTLIDVELSGRDRAQTRETDRGQELTDLSRRKV